MSCNTLPCVTLKKFFSLSLSRVLPRITLTGLLILKTSVYLKYISCLNEIYYM